MEQPDPAQLRISDQDRHQVAEILREAAGEGRLDFEELDERLEATYAAKVYGDLVPITLDLPVRAQSQLPARARPTAPASRPNEINAYVDGPAQESHLAILGGVDRKGVWTVPEHLQVFCFMGGADLDLRQAQFAAQEVTLTINAIMGGADIKVNPRTRVVMEGIGILGGYSGPQDKVPAEFDDQSPVVRIRGFALMGGVSVTRKAMPGGRRSLRRG